MSSREDHICDEPNWPTHSKVFWSSKYRRHYQFIPLFLVNNFSFIMNTENRPVEEKEETFSDEDFDYAEADGVPNDVQKGGKHKGKTSGQSHPHASRGVNI